MLDLAMRSAKDLVPDEFLFQYMDLIKKTKTFTYKTETEYLRGVLNAKCDDASLNYAGNGVLPEIEFVIGDKAVKIQPEATTNGEFCEISLYTLKTKELLQYVSLTTATIDKYDLLLEIDYASADGKGAAKIYQRSNSGREAKINMTTSYKAPTPAPTPEPTTPVATGSSTTEIIVFSAAAAAGIGAAVTLGLFL